MLGSCSAARQGLSSASEASDGVSGLSSAAACLLPRGRASRARLRAPSWQLQDDLVWVWPHVKKKMILGQPCDAGEH